MKYLICLNLLIRHCYLLHQLLTIFRLYPHIMFFIGHLYNTSYYISHNILHEINIVIFCFSSNKVTRQNNNNYCSTIILSQLLPLSGLWTKKWKCIEVFIIYKRIAFIEYLPTCWEFRNNDNEPLTQNCYVKLLFAQ